MEGECQVSRGSCGKENIITAIFGKCSLSQPFTMVPELLHKSKSSDKDKCVLRRKTELRPEAVWLSQCHGQVAFFFVSFISLLLNIQQNPPFSFCSLSVNHHDNPGLTNQNIYSIFFSGHSDWFRNSHLT